MNHNPIEVALNEKWNTNLRTKRQQCPGKQDQGQQTKPYSGGKQLHYPFLRVEQQKRNRGGGDLKATSWPYNQRTGNATKKLFA